MLLITFVKNLRDGNETKVMFEHPRSFEDVRAMFEEQYGVCNAKSEQDFVCQGLYSEYREDEEDYTFENVNHLAKEFERCEAEYGERKLKAFFEEYSYQDLKSLADGSVCIYSSKEAYLDDIYELYGLTDKKFLWTTVDVFLNDDYVFSEIETNGDVYQASNGCIVEMI